MSTIRMEDIDVKKMGPAGYSVGSCYDMTVFQDGKPFLVVDESGTLVDYRVVMKFLDDKKLQTILAYIEQRTRERCAAIAIRIGREEADRNSACGDAEDFGKKVHDAILKDK